MTVAARIGAGGPNLGSLAAVGAKLGVKVIVQIATNNGALIESIAKEVFAGEAEGRSWSSLPAGDRALWVARVQRTVQALGHALGA